MGHEADDISKSFTLAREEERKYGKVKDKLDQHFIIKRNVIFERAKFNMRKQESGEPVDAFFADLHCLSEHCEFRALRDELIRDRIVMGLQMYSLAKNSNESESHPPISHKQRSRKWFEAEFY